MRRIAVQVHHLKPLHTLTITVKEWVREAMADRQYDRPVTHADSGCWHHLDGLVTLCKPHHLEAHAELEQERRMPGQARLL